MQAIQYLLTAPSQTVDTLCVTAAQSNRQFSLTREPPKTTRFLPFMSSGIQSVAVQQE